MRSPKCLHLFSSGIKLDKVGIFKDGTKITEREGLTIEKKNDICTLTISSTIADDEATYSVRPRTSDTDEGQTKVKVIAEPKVEILAEQSEIVVKERKTILIKWKITG